MTTLREYDAARSEAEKLTANERKFISAAICTFGSHDHPYPDDTALPGFTLSYVIECLAKAVTWLVEKNHNDAPAVRVLLEKLRASFASLLSKVDAEGNVTGARSGALLGRVASDARDREWRDEFKRYHAAEPDWVIDTFVKRMRFASVAKIKESLGGSYETWLKNFM